MMAKVSKNYRVDPERLKELEAIQEVLNADMEKQFGMKMTATDVLEYCIRSIYFTLQEENKIPNDSEVSE